MLTVHSESLHHTVAARNPAVAHSPCEHMRSLRVHILEIPKVVVRRLSLRNFVMRFRLPGMNNIGEFDGVLCMLVRDVLLGKTKELRT